MTISDNMRPIGRNGFVTIEL